jgi:hypothetical protein
MPVGEVVETKPEGKASFWLVYVAAAAESSAGVGSRTVEGARRIDITGGVGSVVVVSKGFNKTAGVRRPKSTAKTSDWGAVGMAGVMASSMDRMWGMRRGRLGAEGSTRLMSVGSEVRARLVLLRAASLKWEELAMRSRAALRKRTSRGLLTNSVGLSGSKKTEQGKTMVVMP